MPKQPREAVTALLLRWRQGDAAALDQLVSVWSPDGRYLYFSSDRAGSMNLWRVPIEEASGKALGPPEPVTTPSPYSGYLSVSRDSGHIAYAHLTSTENLFKVAFDPSREAVAGSPAPITRGSRHLAAPDLAPNGDWVAAMTLEPQEDLIVMRTDGTGESRKITDDSSRDRVPKWSPDGKQIAFSSDRSGGWQTWIINADASGRRQLTNAEGGASNPLWSPDGVRMAVRLPPQAQISARVLLFDVRKPWNEQTPETLPLSFPAGASLAPHAWSPDRRRLAVAVGGPGPSAGTYSYDLETRQVQKLTPYVSQNSAARWLRDSRRLLISYQGRLYLIDTLSLKSREVFSQLPNEVAGFSLSQDERLIVYSLNSREADIWLARPGIRRVEQKQ